MTITKEYSHNFYSTTLYIIDTINIIMKWKYSVQFMNGEGNWQETDSFENLSKAFESKDTLTYQMSKVVDLETGNEVYNNWSLTLLYHVHLYKALLLDGDWIDCVRCGEVIEDKGIPLCEDCHK